MRELNNEQRLGCQRYKWLQSMSNEYAWEAWGKSLPVWSTFLLLSFSFLLSYGLPHITHTHTHTKRS